MKIFVCGKGGSGKTVISILLARILTENGNKVYIVDSDESNELLYKLLGTNPPKPLAEYFGGKKNIFKVGEVNILKLLKTSETGININSLPHEYVSYSKEGIGLIVIGKIRTLGEGCACPLNFLTRIFLGNVILNSNEYIIVDTDAGVEHVGRGLEETADLIIFIADPTAESIQLAKVLKKVADEHRIKFKMILNKADNEIYQTFKDLAGQNGLSIDGYLGFDREIFMSSLKGEPLKSKSAYKELKNIITKIL